MTPEQKLAIKADILANPDLAAQPQGSEGSYAIAQMYKAASIPAYIVWKTNLQRADIYNPTSPEGTTWDWNIYKAQSVTEQGAWREMFMNDQANPSLANFRAGVEKIFGINNVQTIHVKAVSKRTANRLEKLLATGLGTVLAPSTLTFEGELSYSAIESARNA